MASQLLGIKTRFTNDLGSPLVGGQVYTYFAGTSTNQDSYSDAALTVPNTNPVILDDTGSADIFLKGAYRIRVFDKLGRFIEEQDNVTQAASQGDATELTNKVNAVEVDLNKVKFDTGISTTIKANIATATNRNQSEKNLDIVSIEDFGCIGGGEFNNDIPLAIALNSGVPLFMPDKDYLYTHVTVDNDVSITGFGRFKYSGAAATGTPAATMIFNGAVKTQQFSIVTEGVSDAIYNLAVFTADNVDLGAVVLKSTQQRNERGGIEIYGNHINTGDIYSKNIGRPVSITNENGDASNLEVWRKDVTVGTVIMDTALRGLKVRYVDGFNRGDLFVFGEWVGSSAIPGHNGTLIESIKNSKIGDSYISDCGEHAFRFGCPVGSDNFTVGDIHVKNSGGSAFKIAPTPPFKLTNGRVGNIVGYNIGKGLQTGNKEVVRLSSLNNVNIGNIQGLVAGTRTLVMADVKNLTVGDVHGENMSARIVEFDMGQDMTSGDCENINIGVVSGTVGGGARSAVSTYYQDGRNIKNLRIKDVLVKGYSVAAVGLENALISDSSINVTLLAGEVQNAFDKASMGVTARVKTAIGRYIGSAANAYVRGVITVDSPKMLTTSSTDPSGLYISSLSVASAKEALGGWIGFSRLGSSRRAAGIALIQTDTDDTKNGLAFYTQNNSTTANEGVQMSMQLKHNGAMNLPQLPTSATGLVAGDVYRDAGVLKIV